MPLFDAYVMVDWSANATPKTGADSIWYAEFRREGRRLDLHALANPPTRAAATAEVATRLAALAQAGRRVLAGFDFPFGYPAGTARRLGLKGVPWRAIWHLLANCIEDTDDNANNRFEVGALLNERMSGAAFPFWGLPPRRFLRHLSPRKPRPHGPGEPAERRLCEHRAMRAQPVWKLAYTGSVGSQALTGIPRVRQIRRDQRLAATARIWPFETGLADDSRAQVVLAEVYPSLFGADPIDGLPKDAGQVSATARGIGECDSDGALAALLEGDPGLSDSERTTVETEEAWILGLAKATTA